MVLTMSMKKKLIAIIIFINIFLSFNVYAVSVKGLLQYSETSDIDMNRLELLEDRQIMHIKYEYAYQATGIYIIRNKGDEYKTTLGVLLFADEDIDSNPYRMDMEFFVNDEKVSYYTITDQRTLTFGGETYEIRQNLASWALIDVSFPAKSTITIRVQYKNHFGSAGMHEGAYVSYNYQGGVVNSIISRSYWKGPTRFSLEIRNDFISENNVDQYWVTDFSFETVASIRTLTDVFFLNANDFLAELMGLETNLLTIDKISGNSFRIEFKKEFLEKYERSFGIYLKELNNDARFIHCNGDSPGISLEYQKDQYGKPRGHSNTNISERALGTYELIFFTKNQLRVMRNAIYAQYGYVFKSEDLRNIFTSSPMMNYEPNPNFHEGMLTDIDRQNIETIQRLEAMTG